MNKQQMGERLSQICAEMRDDGMINVEHEDGSECRHSPICEHTTLQITEDGSRFYERYEQRIKHG